jgi:hypothetical protein
VGGGKGGELPSLLQESRLQKGSEILRVDEHQTLPLFLTSQ